MLVFKEIRHLRVCVASPPPWLEMQQLRCWQNKTQMNKLELTRVLTLNHTSGRFVRGCFVFEGKQYGFYRDWLPHVNRGIQRGALDVKTEKSTYSTVQHRTSHRADRGNLVIILKSLSYKSVILLRFLSTCQFIIKLSGMGNCSHPISLWGKLIYCISVTSWQTDIYHK